MAMMAPKHNIVQINRGTLENGRENCWQEMAAEYVLRMFLLRERVSIQQNCENLAWRKALTC